MIVANDQFKDKEYIDIKDAILEADGVVIVASLNGGLCNGVDGLILAESESFDEIRKEDFDALVLVGGVGAMTNLGNKDLITLMKYFVAEKVFGAICIAPRIPLAAGVLEGYNVTGFDGDRKLIDYIQKGGAKLVHEGVVVDQNVITADSPMTAWTMGERLVKMLQK